MPNLKIEQEKWHCFICALAHQLLFIRWFSAAVADSLQRHATRLL